MRMSELSMVAGMPVATIKYYLREGLVPAGSSLTATSSSYNGAHVERLQLIRALVEGAGLSIAQVRRVAQTLDNPPDSWHDMLGTAQGILCGPADQGLETASADRLLARLGWAVGDCSPARADLARALADLDAAGLEVSAEDLDGYAAAARSAATIDVASLPTDSRDAALRQAIIGTALLDPVLVALRRLAQEHVSTQTFGDKRTSRGRAQPRHPRRPRASEAVAQPGND